MQDNYDFQLSTKDKAIIIARILRAVGFNLIANHAEHETSESMLKGYLRIAEVKAAKNPDALAEAYNFGLLEIPLPEKKEMRECPF